MNKDKIPLDVWLRFDSEDDEEATYEANTYGNDEEGYTVEWYHTAVGLVSHKWVPTLDDAHQWYLDNGFVDFTVKEDDGSTNAAPGVTL